MGIGKIASYIAGLQAGLLVALAAPAVPASAAPEEEARDASKGVHLSLSGGYFRPWDSADDGGFSIGLSGMKSIGKDRFWVGGEIEFRHSSVDVKSDFSPDYDSLFVRYLFQYHPWPKALVSPYVGIGTGIGLYVVDRYARINGDKQRYRHPVSAGLTLLGLLGAQVSLSQEPPISAFVEGRLGSTTDLWQKKGANFQYDQVGGLTASAGLRWSF